MNKVILNIISIVIIGCIFTMCTKDNNENVPESKSETKIANAVIDFRIKAADLQTYASSAEEAGIARENQIGSSVNYYVFDSDGLFETSGTVSINPENGCYRSEQLLISAGDKYFYILPINRQACLPNLRQAPTGLILKNKPPMLPWQNYSMVMTEW